MKRTKKSERRPLVTTSFLVVGLVLGICIYGGAEELPPALDTIPSNPLSGRVVFEERGCIDCHDINAFGKKIGPALGGEKVFDNFYDLASRLWNHAPQMAVQAGSLKKEWPTMNRSELDGLISFLFFLRYLGEPGDIENGQKLLRKKTCLNCHRIGKEGAPEGITLDRLSEYASPLYTAQVIWNHGPTMQKKMIAGGISRPVFDDNDITDISAYLREYSRGQTVKRQYMSPGNPRAGFQLFKEKGCIKCHSMVRGQSSIGPGLHSMALHRSVTAIAAKMWNHGSMMSKVMEEENIRWPEFKESEMADLIAFLYFFDYYGSPGDEKKGEQVFRAKSCIKCHGTNTGDTTVTFGKSIRLDTPNDLVRTMWNHVPYMHEVTITKNIKWPELTEKDLRDLYAYLLKWFQRNK